MSAQDDQINELNERVRVRLAPSKIHGVGVFALRAINKGEKIYGDITPSLYSVPYSSFKKLFPEIRELLLGQFPQIVNGSRFVYPTERVIAFMNHSENENYDAVNDIMLRDVKRGAEITENYKAINNWWIVHPWLKELEDGIIKK